jgi:[ribosomal protein S5]-alanine N-acetyltransferase
MAANSQVTAMSKLRVTGTREESLLICLRSTGAIAGMVKINSIIRRLLQGGSVGYAAFASTARQGYMTEGLGLVVRYAFHRRGSHNRGSRP